MLSCPDPTRINPCYTHFKIEDAVRSSPVIVDHIVCFGSNDDHVYAVERGSAVRRV
uniref:PQQ-binding-like beta-propeller repeat protein n=1 Tax=Cohnella cholangitidis TaxID=2598458 RepID=UPI003898DEE9